jgi:hypothetical protein
VATAVNFVDRCVPTNVTEVMMTTATNEAMRPYSMAVTPLSSLAKRSKRVLIIMILDIVSLPHCIDAVDI